MNLQHIPNEERLIFSGNFNLYLLVKNKYYEIYFKYN